MNFPRRALQPRNSWFLFRPPHSHSLRPHPWSLCRCLPRPLPVRATLARLPKRPMMGLPHGPLVLRLGLCIVGRAFPLRTMHLCHLRLRRSHLGLRCLPSLIQLLGSRRPPSFRVPHLLRLHRILALLPPLPALPRSGLHRLALRSRSGGPASTAGLSRSGARVSQAPLSAFCVRARVRNAFPRPVRLLFFIHCL